MRLADFILANLERILQAWEDFARSLSRGRSLSIAALRDHAEHMLRFIARDMETAQSPHDQFLKSIGEAPRAASDNPTAAQDHGLERAVDRFTLTELVGEYRALRASVLSLWLGTADAASDTEQIIRFNEAIDQLIAESVEEYSGKLDADADVFTASIGHDLRNPLNAISMSAQALELSAALSNEEKNAVRQIAQSAGRMGTMLGELQDFSRVRLGALLSFEREMLDVARLCEEVVEEIRAAAPDRSITFSQSGNVSAAVSRERIAQMMSNLVGNAVQHGAKGTTVDVAVIGENGSLRIKVHNAGSVIPHDALDRIFEPLYRTSNAPDEKRIHLGLGLYIARTIARAHHGDIEATSTEDAGTTFEVRLPRTA